MLKKLILPLIFSLILSKSFTVDNNLLCTTLIETLNINALAYKNCLMKSPNNEYTRDDINMCKKYYLTEIERLSYVYKNICK